MLDRVLICNDLISKFSCQLVGPYMCSFIGNPGLCGYWLQSACRDSHPTERGNHQVAYYE